MAGLSMFLGSVLNIKVLYCRGNQKNKIEISVDWEQVRQRNCLKNGT
jgi:hypothetical protein